jgi:hypothetical protein
MDYKSLMNNGTTEAPFSRVEGLQECMSFLPEVAFQ